jgi:hypothetical protein
MTSSQCGQPPFYPYHRHFFTPRQIPEPVLPKKPCASCHVHVDAKTHPLHELHTLESRRMSQPRRWQRGEPAMPLLCERWHSSSQGPLAGELSPSSPQLLDLAMGSSCFHAHALLLLWLLTGLTPTYLLCIIRSQQPWLCQRGRSPVTGLHTALLWHLLRLWFFTLNQVLICLFFPMYWNPYSQYLIHFSS